MSRALYFSAVPFLAGSFHRLRRFGRFPFPFQRDLPDLWIAFATFPLKVVERIFLMTIEFITHYCLSLLHAHDKAH